MGINKKYDGYVAYSYLDEHDFERFELCDADKTFPSYLIPLSEEEESRVEKLAAENVMISLHEHPVLFPKNMDEVFAFNREGRQSCAYEALSRSYLDCVFDNLMDGTCTIHSKVGWKWSEVLQDLGVRLCDLEQQTYAIRCGKVEDIYRAFNEGKIAVVPVIEGAAPIENELDRIDILYGFGVRLLGITYSESNGLGTGLKEDRDGGLTAFGRQAVKRMNQVGMAIDCSHASKQTTLDVVEVSEKPIFLSHIGARALWDSKRLADDEVLKAVAAAGGLIGIEAAPHTTLTKAHPDHSVYSVMDHFEYVKDLVGIDHVSFGPDTLYGDHVGLHRAFAAHLSTGETKGNRDDYEEVDYVKGFENPTEASHNIVRYMVSQNYSDEDIAKVMGLNTIRVLEANWA